ncbi:MAG: sugar ABC transporter permease [Nitrososphaerales archaeon]|jgi:ABC-type sugar transport system permease subunit
MESKSAPADDGEEKVSRIAAFRRWFSEPFKFKTTMLFLIPPLVFAFIFILYPLSEVIYLSFTYYTGFLSPVWIGLTNYHTLLGDPVLSISLVNNIIWVVVFLVLNNFLGLMLAGSIDIMGRKLSSFFRVVLYLSVLLPTVAISYLFLALYSPEIGLIDAFFKDVGLTALSKTDFLGNPSLTLYSVLGSSIWQYAAFPMLIFIAAFASINPSLYEAAVIDGANQWQIFWRIKVPIIRPVIVTMLALTYIWNSQPFSQIYTMTKGGPGNASQVLVSYLYQTAYSGLRIGYASAIAILIFLIIFPVAIVFFRTFEK